MKKSIFALLAAVLIFNAAPAHSVDEDELKKVDTPAWDSGGYIGIDFFDTFTDGASLLLVTNDRTDENVDSWRTVLCDSVIDSKCQIPGYNLDALSIFSPCSSEIAENCIEYVKATLPDGTSINGVPGKLWNPNGKYKGDKLFGIPDGGQASTWTLKGTNPSGSEDYVLIAGVEGQMKMPKTRSKLSDENLFWGNIFANLQPVRVVDGSYDDPKMTLIPRGKTGVGTGGGLSTHRGCFMNDTTQCALRSTFPLDVTYSIKFKFDVRVASWLRGRLTDPIIETENSGQSQSTMTITAKAATVPEVAGYIKWSETPDWMKKKYPAGYGGTGNSTNAFTTQDLDTRILRVNGGSSGPRSLAEFKDWIPFLLDKPMAMKTYWNVQSVYGDTKMNQCAKEKFAGYVTSNATVYSSGAPMWNESEQSLDYTVGAPHYDTKGNLMKGQYLLGIKSEVARCLYGFSNAPISAKIEIASEDGNPNVATTVVRENKETGLLTLAANGFHYSTPKVKVTFVQEAVPTATPSATPTPQASAPAAPAGKKITCVKGKIVKTIKGLNPKCPAGYKKR